MPIINLIMFLLTLGSYVGLKLTGHSDPATENALIGFAGISLGGHVGSTTPVFNGGK